MVAVCGGLGGVNLLEKVVLEMESAFSQGSRHFELALSAFCLWIELSDVPVAMPCSAIVDSNPLKP